MLPVSFCILNFFFTDFLEIWYELYVTVSHPKHVFLQLRKTAIKRRTKTLERQKQHQRLFVCRLEVMQSARFAKYIQI